MKYKTSYFSFRSELFLLAVNSTGRGMKSMHFCNFISPSTYQNSTVNRNCHHLVNRDSSGQYPLVEEGRSTMMQRLTE